MCRREYRGERCPGPLREQPWETIARLRGEVADLRAVACAVRDLADAGDLHHLVDFLEDELPNIRGDCAELGHRPGSDGTCTRCGTFMF